MNQVIDLLEARGAGGIPHPGGILLAHLRRVHALLESWGARPALRLAGLAHAFYGTDGFPTALGDVAHRGELTAVAGREAERLVYLYGSCDRALTYPHLREGGFHDRFTGTVRTPLPSLRRDFAELTAANELDVLAADAGLRAEHGRALLDLFTAWDDLLSVPARAAVRAGLP